MNKTQIYSLLESRGIPYEITEHEAVYTMEELSHVALPYPEGDAKNLFVRDDKRLHYYLITVRGDKRVDLKAFRRAHGTRVLSFASPEELMTHLELTPGAVTPLGLLNRQEPSVELFLDSSFLEEPGMIGVHPNDNTATVWLKAQDLIDLLRGWGVTVHLVEF